MSTSLRSRFVCTLVKVFLFCFVPCETRLSHSRTCIVVPLTEDAVCPSNRHRRIPVYIADSYHSAWPLTSSRVEF